LPVNANDKAIVGGVIDQGSSNPSRNLLEPKAINIAFSQCALASY